MNPYRGTAGEVIDPSKINVYRGGTDLTVRPGDVKVDRHTGLVLTTHGLSLDTDPAGLGRFGGPHRVASVPDELQIAQRGQRKTHFEIVPKLPMTMDHFQELVSQIVLV
jgi:hypothetical protein